MKHYYLYEFETGRRYGPASEENIELYKQHLKDGSMFFSYPYHGYYLHMVVKAFVEEKEVSL